MFMHAHTQVHRKSLQKREAIFIPRSKACSGSSLVGSEGLARFMVWGRLAPSAQLAVHCLLPLIRLSSPYAQAAFPHRTWPPPAFHVMLAPPCSCSHPTALSHTVPGTRHRVPEALEGLPWVQSSHCFSHFPLHKPALPFPEAYTCHYASWGSLHSCDWVDLPNHLLTPPSDNISLFIAHPRYKVTKVVTLPAILWRDCFSNSVSLGKPYLNGSSLTVSSGFSPQPEGAYTEEFVSCWR